MVPRSLQGFRSRFCLPGGGSSSRLAIRRACKRREPPFPSAFSFGAKKRCERAPPLSQSRRAPARPVVPPAGCRVQVVILSAGRRPESKDPVRRQPEGFPAGASCASPLQGFCHRKGPKTTKPPTYAHFCHTYSRVSRAFAGPSLATRDEGVEKRLFRGLHGFLSVRSGESRLPAMCA